MIELPVTVCPSCQCRELKPHTLYETMNYGERTTYQLPVYRLRTVLLTNDKHFPGRDQEAPQPYCPCHQSEIRRDGSERCLQDLWYF